MTTIATDGRSMAADGLCTGDGLIHGTASRKIKRRDDGRIVGAAGDAYSLDPFCAWLETGGDHPPLNKQFEALVLLPNGECLSFNERCQSCPQEVPTVTGSGGALALGAMLAGCSPAEAVAIAAQRDVSSGGTIIVEHLE